MCEQRKPDEKLRSLFWSPELHRMDRERVYNRKVEILVFAIQRQHGLQSEPRRIWLKEAPPNLTDTMMKLVEGYRVAMICEMMGDPSPALPSSILPELIDLVPETQLAAVLAALRTAAGRLHEEDDTPPMHVARFFAGLRGGAR